MISSIRRLIANKLKELYPMHKVYADDIPQEFKTPSFIIYVINQDYNKRLNNKFKSELSFDVTYHSDKGVEDVKSDCQDMQVDLFRAFDMIETYRVLNKQATIVDNVLHLTFSINYSEIKVETGIPMQKQQTNTNI